MTYIITMQELEHLSEAELRAMYHRILADLAHRNLNIDDCPMAIISLQNIQRVLARKQALKHKAPRF